MWDMRLAGSNTARRLSSPAAGALRSIGDRKLNAIDDKSKAAAALGPRMDASAIQRLLVERICLLRYRPGDQLKEAELAREFGVSRTPVRDALNRISHLGMIESRNGVGTVVVRLSEEQIRHVYEMRLELACLIGKLSPVAPDPGHLAALQGLLQRARRLRDGFKADEYVLINHELHEVIASMIGNSSLRSMWLQTYVQAASTWYMVAQTREAEVTDALLEELTDLVNAVKHGDAEAVGFVQRIHIQYGFAKINAMLEEGGLDAD